MKFSLYGRVFEVLAVFPDTDQGVEDANNFILNHPKDVGVLATFKGEIILADCNDEGVHAPLTTPSARVVGECPACLAINRHELNCDLQLGNPHWVERGER